MGHGVMVSDGGERERTALACSDSIDDGLGLLGPTQGKRVSMISWAMNVRVAHSYTLAVACTIAVELRTV